MGIVYEGYGNVLNHEAQTITCPVNIVGVMGKGLALAMRNRFSGLMEHYKNLCEDGNLYIGKVATYEVQNSDKQVLLFPTKEHWRSPSELEFVEEGLIYLSKNYKSLGITSLAIIPLGCGLGGLSYTKEVKALMYQYLNPLPIDVFLLHRNDI